MQNLTEHEHLLAAQRNPYTVPHHRDSPVFGINIGTSNSVAVRRIVLLSLKFSVPLAKLTNKTPHGLFEMEKMFIREH